MWNTLWIHMDSTQQQIKQVVVENGQLKLGLLEPSTGSVGTSSVCLYIHSCGIYAHTRVVYLRVHAHARAQ